MPTYVYACKSCGHGFEQHQSFSDDALTTCPACGQETLRKVFNSVGIVFKGSGFYKTDSRSGTGAAASGTTASEPAAATPQTGGTSEGAAPATAAGSTPTSTGASSGSAGTSSSSSASSSTSAGPSAA